VAAGQHAVRANIHGTAAAAIMIAKEFEAVLLQAAHLSAFGNCAAVFASGMPACVTAYWCCGAYYSLLPTASQPVAS
jgi:hypothetical protein